MQCVRYTAWPGAAATAVSARAVFAALAAELSRTPDVEAALEELLRHGVPLPGGSVAGIAELLERVRAGIGERAAEEFLRRRGPHAGGVPPSRPAAEAWRALEEQLERGELEAVDADLVAALGGSEARRILEVLRAVRPLLCRAGYLLWRDGRLRLSPRGVRRIGRLALREIHGRLRRGPGGDHRCRTAGAMRPLGNAVRPWRFGDGAPVDVAETLAQALRRRPAVPVRLDPRDFRVHDAERTVRSATVLLLDMSWSMSWEGRFAAAKRVALALDCLIRTRYPRDYYAVVGFFTRAVELRRADLPEASWNAGDPFTNLQEGLRLAAALLGRHPGPNRQVLLITDGQPTAYIADGRVRCEWPLTFGGVSPRAAEATLAEVARLTRRGIVINTFMLDDGPPLRAFVEGMTRLNRGRAFYTRPDRLGEYVLVDYVARRRGRP